MEEGGGEVWDGERGGGEFCSVVPGEQKSDMEGEETRDFPPGEIDLILLL